MIIKAGTEDGYIFKYQSTWPPSASIGLSSTDTILSWQAKKTDVYYIMRSYLRFNTSSIPAGAVITSAKLWFKLYAKYNVDNFNLQTQIWRDTGDWGTLDTGDWGCGDIQIATKNYADLPAVGNWFSIDIPVNQINKGGITAFEIRGDHESGTTPTGQNVVTVYSAENSGSEPYLEISYILPGAILLMQL